MQLQLSPNLSSGQVNIDDTSEMMIVNSDQDVDSNVDNDSNDNDSDSDSNNDYNDVQQWTGQQACFTSCAEVASSGCECQCSRASKA